MLKNILVSLVAHLLSRAPHMYMEQYQYESGTLPRSVGARGSAQSLKTCTDIDSNSQDEPGHKKPWVD